jgi:hypothetical protein
MTATSGCWLQVGASGGHTRHNTVESTLDAATVSGLHQVWSADLNGQVSEPIVWKGRVFVTVTGANGVGVSALDLAGGDTLWSRSLLGGVGGEGSIVLGTPVTVVDGQLWTGHLGYAPFAPGGGPACVSGADVLDPETGAGGGAGDYPSAAGEAGGIVARTRLRLGSGCANSSLYLDVRVSPPGEPATQWTADLGPVASGSLVPTVAGGQVFVVVGSNLRAYAAGGCGGPTCAPIWSATFPTSASATMAGETGPVFVIAESALIALDRTAGGELWRVPFDVGSGAGGMALADGVAYVTVTPSGGAPSLVALDAGGCGAATCTPLWTAALPGTWATAPAVAGGVVYVSTTGGVEVFAAGGCGAATCPSLVSVPSPVAGTLSVAQGHVLVSSTGRVAALGLG